MRMIVRSLMLLIAALMCRVAVAADVAKPDAAKAESGTAARKKVVFIAGGPSHGFMAHDHLAGCELLAKRIREIPGYEADVHYKTWPEAKAFNGAAAIVIYCDGGGGHMAIPHMAELKAMSAKGTGVGFIHYAVEVPKEKGGPEWLDVTGGYFETFFSINPHWDGHFTAFPKHPVASGVAPFTTNDEWYYHMRFREEMKGVTPILSAIPPDKTRQGKDDAHGGNPAVRDGVGKNIPEHVLWVSENTGGSRGFGCTGGHFHKNWANDQFRKTVLNAIVWIAQGEVPATGIESKRPDVEEILANRDPDAKNEQVPANFDKAKLAQELEDLNKPTASKAKQSVRPNAGEELLKPVAGR